MCTAKRMDKRKKTRELCDVLRNKIIAKHGQSQGYKHISIDLDVPVFITHNVIKKFNAHGTVANLTGCGHERNLDARLQ